MSIIGHDHHTHAPVAGSRLWLALGLTLAFCLGEVAVGLITNSLALLSDAGHNFGDALALGLSGYAAWLTRKPATAHATYGYHRAAILAPLFNAATLIVTSLLIAVAAVQRLFAPQPVEAMPVIWMAAAALAMNAVTALFLARDARHSLNDRSVFIHIAGDALTSLAVIAGGVIIRLTGWALVDPIVSLGIAVFIAYSATGILRQTIAILMEAVPQGTDIAGLTQCIGSVTEVQAVHHLHVWALRDGITALSCHVVLPDECSLKDCSATISEINRRLHDEHGIYHATIQVEQAGGCVTAEAACVVEGHGR